MNRFDLMALRYRTWCSTLTNSSTYHTNCELVILLVKSIFKRSNMWIARRKTTCPKQVDKTFFEPWLKNLYKLIIISDSSFNPKLDNCLPKKKTVGYALFFYIYSTYEGRSLYLEDLYVNPAFRGKVNYRSIFIWYFAVMYCLNSIPLLWVSCRCTVLSQPMWLYSLPTTLKIWIQLSSAVIKFWVTRPCYIVGEFYLCKKHLTGNFTHSIKEKSSILSCNVRCYRLIGPL